MYDSGNLIVWRTKTTIQIAISDEVNEDFEDALYTTTELTIDQGKELFEELKKMLEMTFSQ